MSSRDFWSFQFASKDISILNFVSIFSIAFLSIAMMTGVVGAETDPFWNDKEAPLSQAERLKVEQSACSSIKDGFEKPLSEVNWNPKFVKPKKRFEIQSRKYSEGSKALSIELVSGDKPNSSGKYKHELRIANDKRCNFGEEIWYSFSFLIDGKYPIKGSTRWVVGQWKEESGASPFLAQRFDNGVFHISIQRNKNREIVASSPGDYDAQFAFLSKIFTQSNKDIGSLKELSRQNIEAKVREFGPSAFDLQSFREAIAEQDIKKFPFVADPENYNKIPGIKIETSQNPFLPDPSIKWVQMRYRVKGDRDGSGLIEIWANNVFIARVTGQIGSDVFDGPTQYFKFGHYRDVDSKFENSKIYLDRFKRGRLRTDVD